MSIPDYERIMLPLLKFCGDKQEHSMREAIEYISQLFKLSEEEKRELLPEGRQPIIDNRTSWARIYLEKAGLLESTKKGHFRITNRGLELLKQNPSEISMKYLDDFARVTGGENFKEQDKTFLMWLIVGLTEVAVFYIALNHFISKGDPFNVIIGIALIIGSFFVIVLLGVGQ